jgi:hypothetical protein
LPLVAQTSIPLPDTLQALDGRLPVLMRPVDPNMIVAVLAGEMREREQGAALVEQALLQPGWRPKQS